MKTEFAINFHSDASTNLINDFSIMAAKHNCGKSFIDMLAIHGYFKAYCARWEHNEAESTYNVNARELTLFMKPGEPFLTITEKRIHELKEESANPGLFETLGEALNPVQAAWSTNPLPNISVSHSPTYSDTFETVQKTLENLK